MKKLLKFLIFCVVLFIVIVGCGILYLSKGLNSGASLDVNAIDLSNVEDGVYTGNYDSGRWTNKIEVTVENHKITNIKIIDDVTFVKPGVSDELFSKVIEEQNTNVEVVSGATVTSKAYLKAIEEALNK